MFSRIDRILNSRATVYASSAVSLGLGLFFIFVWSPLPWGWHGIDFYYEISTGLAKGQPFPTMHIPWGYAYFLAFWYRVFGDHQWIPLCAQAVLNATIPLMLYHLVRIEIGPRVGVMSAVVAGLFSFNTVYTSTQASDAVCTVLVVAAMLCFAVGRHRQRPLFFALAGALAGLACQFRPNFVLFPFFTAGLYILVRPYTAIKAKQMVAFVAVFAAVAAPWVVRNYLWSGMFVPASTHGGVQLWFGTLQAGAYEDSWPYNPRAAFENPPIDYTSVVEQPIVVTAGSGCDLGRPWKIELVYWTNRDRTPRHLPGTWQPDGMVSWTVPQQPAPTALYYYYEGWWTERGRAVRARTPRDGPRVPFMYVISRDHLTDLDVDGYMLDIFDLVRLIRHVAWADPIAADPRLDLDGDGAWTRADIDLAAALLVEIDRPLNRIAPVITGFTHDASRAVLTFRDGSTLTVPRQSSGKITDLVPVGDMASAIQSRSRAFASISPAALTPDPDETTACLAVVIPTINRVPYRRQPHEMRRFVALAMDNIRANPRAYLLASLHRAFRVFVIEGSADKNTAAQFSRSGLVYQAARAASLLYLLLFAAGLVIAIRERQRLFVLLTPIVYVPLTICFVLINARYSMTIQPFVFAVIAIALVHGVDRITAAQADQG